MRQRHRLLSLPGGREPGFARGRRLLMGRLATLTLAVALWCDRAGAAVPPPLPPSPPSPITFFRTLLHTNAEGRVLALAGRPEPQRRAIEAKLVEYDALPVAEREQRLLATEFRYHIRPLLLQPPTNPQRRAQIDALPESVREVIRERLTRWDALPAPTRDELLGYDRALTWLARNRVQSLPTSALALPPPLPSGDAQLDQALARWHRLPETRRDELCHQFESFFELPDPERERAMASFSDVERLRMEETLAAFAKLPPAERRLCLRSFRRFASLGPAERASFLQSADRWREMSPQDREQWRQLVSKLPPLPPGFNSPPPLPPFPTALVHQPSPGS